MGDRGKLVTRWQTSLRKGTDFDSWGQVVEAVEEYQMLERQLNKEMNAKPPVFSESQKKTLQQIMACLNLRAETLQSPSATDELSLEELKKLDKALQDLLSSSPSEFPVDLPAGALRTRSPKMNLDIDIEGEEDEEDEEEDAMPQLQSKSQNIKPTGTLLPRIAHEPGTTGLSIHLEKIGLKDSTSYLDPFITVSVKDMAGVDVMKSQDTPVATKREDQYVIYKSNVELQKPLEKLPKGTAVFFEFKHYKAKKRTISCKCFAFMEMDEIKHGPLVIELYRKPTDFKRKKLSLLTSKPLYLHLNLILYEN
ncbi:axin interactor, dorsalization-associated protein isoform X1 [Strongylocentrotus purpuratus]|uniref:C2 Aida-type domain-containing protein n=1 Tax=Strongylocentrotus purpuratus TaxID=7668 RepID=A0A7M7PUG9_STRPU|nr:axin interactor, dorsalization-associated protein isoform X1 [Strongylocentrotus purpuratus]